MKGKFPAFQFYPDAWLSSTAVSLMTPAEEGAYIRLLCHAWQSDDCGLPDDDEALASLSRLGKKWIKSAHRIRPKFEKIGGRLFNNRLIEERQKQIEWREKSARGGFQKAENKGRGLQGGRRVVEGWQPNGTPLVGQMVGTKRLPTPLPNTYISSSSSSSFSDAKTTSEKANTSTANAVEKSDPPAAEFELGAPALVPLSVKKSKELTAYQQTWFEQWWEIYWRKESKKDAKSAFAVHVRSLVRFEEVMRATKEQTAEMLHRESGHRPLGATWLNGERWEDEQSPDGRPRARDSTGSKRERSFVSDVAEVISRNFEEEGRPW